LVLLVLLLACAGSGPVVAQDVLPLSVLPSDPLKAGERQNATRQTLAEHRLAIEQLRGEIARLNAEQPAKLQALSGETAEELKRILDDSGLWDGRAWGLQVTDTPTAP
jgi:hypothetical protein